MPAKNDFARDHPLPRFLSERAGKSEQLPFVATRDRTVNASRAVGVTSALVGIVTVIGILTVGDPAAIFADVTFDQSKPVVQPTSASQNLPQTANDAPKRYEITTALEPTEQNQAQTNQLSTEDLFKQFQAWAAEKDERAKTEPEQFVQDAPKQVAQDARPNPQIMKSQRQVRVRHARAEVRSLQNSQMTSRQGRNVRMQVRPMQDAPAQAQPAQNAAAPSSAQSFSLRN